MKHKFAAQLYTARAELQQDCRGVLRELKEMGWPAVQMGGYYGLPPEEVAGYVKENGFQVAGMHVDLPRLENDLEAVLREAELFDTRDLVCPFLPPKLRTEEGYTGLRRSLNEIARRIAPQGFRLSYHNHAFEFETAIGGTNALEYLLEPAEGNLLLAEIDVYWVKRGGHDPVRFIEPYAGRMPLIHLKDMTDDDRQYFAEIGTGRIDFSPLLLWGEQNGVEWYIVEQDQCPGNALDSLRISFANLNRLADSFSLNKMNIKRTSDDTNETR